MILHHAQFTQLKNNLLHLTGWKQFARLARREKQLLRMVRQSVLHSFRHSPVYKYGVQVPRNHHEAMALDKKNGNRYWEEAEETEIGQILAYDTFKDLGKKRHCAQGYRRTLPNRGRVRTNPNTRYLEPKLWTRSMI